MKTVRDALPLMAILAAVSLTPGMAGDKDKPTDAKKEAPASVYDFTMNNIDGKPVKLSGYKGQVLLIVNVASECGLTEANYKGLAPLHAKYKDEGLRILAIPANNFGGQEPGTDAEIKSFCTGKYDAKYDLFAKVSVKGDDICPLYQYLTTHPDKKIKGEVAWNFQKYLVGRDGQVIERFNPKTKPDDDKLVEAIEDALKEKAPAKP